MRTIKFRGKCTDNREMVYGYLAEGNFICRWSEGHVSMYEVKATTVGQFTGLHDKNNKEIYEGDIIVSNKGLKGVITWSCNNASFQIELRNTKPVCGVFNASVIKDFEIMVIGNIHDNPELLKNND